MQPLTLNRIQAAFDASFALDTCSEDDLPFWTVDNPSRGHCAVAALTLHDLIGGDLLLAIVERDDVQVGYHYWNRLAGVDIDLTRDQFIPGESVSAPNVVVRPPERPGNYAEQYDVFRRRVGQQLGIQVGPRN